MRVLIILGLLCTLANVYSSPDEGPARTEPSTAEPSTAAPTTSEPTIEAPCPHKFKEEGSITVTSGTEVKYKNFQPLSGNEFRFRVQAYKDGRVILTTQPKDSTPDYEIIVGAYNNTKSIIRKNKKKPDKVTIENSNRLMSAKELRGFWIHVEDGTITVGKECEDKPFISYMDPNPINVTFAGISNGFRANGTFLLEAPAAKKSVILPEDII